MSGAPRVRSMNVADSESRSVFGPVRNKAELPSASKTTPLKSSGKVEKSLVEVMDGGEEEEEKKKKKFHPLALSSRKHSVSGVGVGVPSVLRRHEQLLLHSSLSLNASCSSDASTDSFHSRASTGRLIRSNSVGTRRKTYPSRPRSVVSEGGLDCHPDGTQTKKRCAWLTPNTDPCYVAFHDEEWGVQVHDDKRLFELLVLSGALAELSWPTILSKRHTFREVFMDFDPIAVSKLNEKKLIAPGSTASTLLSELKLRSVIQNARQVSKVIGEFGSFDKYIWSFVNNKPIVSKFRYPRQVPVKTPKADVISKDLVRRGFRSVGPTVIYSFMQVAGITNDHLTTCFRFHDCCCVKGKQENNNNNNNGYDIVDDKSKVEDKKSNEVIESDLTLSIDELNFSTEL